MSLKNKIEIAYDEISDEIPALEKAVNDLAKYVDRLKNLCEWYQDSSHVDDEESETYKWDADMERRIGELRHPGGINRRIHAVENRFIGHLSGKTGGTADKVFVILLYYLVGYTGFVIVFTLDMAYRDYLHQVLVALVVLGKKNQMVVASVLVILKSVVVMTGNVHLASYDGLYRRMFPGKFEELLDSIHIAVVRYGKGRHTEFLGTLEQFWYGRQSVQNRILGMDVQVYKSHICTNIEKGRGKSAAPVEGF